MILDQDKLIYVYCVTSELPLLNDCLLNSEINFIEHSGLFVTLKSVSENEFSETNIKNNISNESWLEVHVRNHLSVIGEIMKRNTVIPFNFGTIYTTQDTLFQFLDKYLNKFNDSLAYLEDKEEWSVKIFCDKNKIIQNLGLLSQNVADIDLLIKSSSPGKAYLLGKKRKDILEKEISKIYNSYSKDLFSALNLFSEEYRLNLLLSNELTGRDDDMIVNSTFLLKKENIPIFISRTEELVNEYENIGLLLEVAGPWPPYTFINFTN